MGITRRTILQIVALWVVLSGFYWWLIGKTQAEQLVAATAIGLAGGVAVVVLAATARLKFEFEMRWLPVLLLRLPGKALRDLGILAAELCRSLVRRRGGTGALKELPFVSGGKDSKSRGRRVLVVSGISLPPNTVAISTQSNSDSILVHQLVFRNESPTDEEWPL